MKGDAAISEILVLTGPESCGKTTLASALSETCRAPMVPEVSRDFLNQKLSRDREFIYSEFDLLEIANEQLSLERLALAKSPDLLICDTDLLVVIIWSEVRFGHCHPWILGAFDESIAAGHRNYLLCDFNIPWQPDPLREHADSRGELFELYRQKLDYYDLSYTVVEGDPQARLESAMSKLGGRMKAH